MADEEEDSHDRHLPDVPSVTAQELESVELLESTADILHAPNVPTEALDQIESTKSPRRVKVYEMMGDSWNDRGTGFCIGLVKDGEALFLVKSEESRDTVLLESKIIKEDLYQIQQNTLIVWQELDGTDVALSFQEEEGCLEIWNFLRHVQKLLNGQEWDGPEDAHSTRREDDVSDDEGETNINDPIFLPNPTLSTLIEVEDAVHQAMVTVGRREALAKFILGEEYVPKLVSVLEEAEDMESIHDLHRLCNIVKALILLNDAAVFECILRDEVFLGIAGILEYDPDFPQHKAEHRKFLKHGSIFKEVVEIKDREIRQKIHQTFRLQYLKDVILARIIDDPTFSILNTLIFFNQVDIVSHFQHNEEFLLALFGLFDGADADRKSDAVLFIQQFTTIAKTLQAPARASMYKTFIDHGLFKVITFALSDLTSAKVRFSGADILMALIDYDPKVIRQHIINQQTQGSTTLSEILARLLISQEDIGVKSQMTEAMRLLLDPSAGPPAEGGLQPQLRRKDDPEAEKFLEMFYVRDIQVLMAPLLEADFSSNNVLSFHAAALLTNLCDLLCFFIRAHTFRSKFFILSQSTSYAISKVFATNEKHLQLAALRYFRVCIGMNDEFYNRHLIKNNLFAPLLRLAIQSSVKDNLIISASLEFFDFIRRESMKTIIDHLVSSYREVLIGSNMEVFKAIITLHADLQASEGKDILITTQELESTPEKDGLVPRKRPLIDIAYDGDEEEPAMQHEETQHIEHIANDIDDKIGEKRRRSMEEKEDDALDRLSKSRSTPEKKNGSPGSTSSFKKKMISTFSLKKKEKAVE